MQVDGAQRSGDGTAAVTAEECGTGVLEEGAATDLSVGVVVPAYNEAAHISDVIASIPRWVSRIYVVDDASTDGTSDAARAAGDPRVTVISHDENRGVGGAMITGYKAGVADGQDILVKLDADGQMDCEEMEHLVEPLAAGKADYAKGNRFYAVNRNRAMPGLRRFGSAGLSFLTKLSSGYWHVFDSQCGFTAVRTGFLGLIDLDRVATDYFFENDMLIWLNTVNARVVDVPTSTRYGDEVSQVRIHRVAFSFPPRLIGGWWLRVWRKYLVMDFGAIGALGSSGTLLILFGLVFGAYHWWLSDVTRRPASTGTVMIAVLPVIVGVQLLLQAFAIEVHDSPGAAATRELVHDLIVRGRLS
jgi:dolichol-phosphate mannosyltransferase